MSPHTKKTGITEQERKAAIYSADLKLKYNAIKVRIHNNHTIGVGVFNEVMTDSGLDIPVDKLKYVDELEEVVNGLSAINSPVVTAVPASEYEMLCQYNVLKEVFDKVTKASNRIGHLRAMLYTQLVGVTL